MTEKMVKFRAGAVHVALLLSSVWAGPALAADQDVIVMRRVVSPGVYSAHVWQVGPWTGPAQCSDTAGQTRTVSCVTRDAEAAAPDANCQGPKPDRSRVIVDHSACSYRWAYGTYGPWAEACSDATYRTRQATCQRYGAGSVAITMPDAASCTGPKEGLRDDAANYSGCSYAWRTTAGACVGSKRAQTVRCERSGGSSLTASVTDETLCGISGKPASQVDDPVCAGIPVIANGDFEDGLTGWSSAHGAGADMLVETHNGSKAATLYSLDSSSGANLIQTVTVKPGATITFAYDVSLLSGKFAGELSSSARVTSTGAAIISVTHLIISETPKEYSITFTVPANVTKVNLQMVGWAQGAAGTRTPTAYAIDNVRAR